LRWTRLGRGDLETFLGLPEEEMPASAWTRSVLSGKEAAPLLEVFDGGFAERFRHRLGVEGFNSLSMTIVGFGPDPANVHPAAALLVRKAVEDDDDGTSYAVHLDDVAYAPGMDEESDLSLCRGCAFFPTKD
jgi:hypothetical protein